MPSLGAHVLLSRVGSVRKIVSNTLSWSLCGHWSRFALPDAAEAGKFSRNDAIFSRNG
ncbi:hypothetical protein D516_1963 [Rhodobacter sp. AKP1]|nr:hypothetical protein D516_1963 [Rhodobacter sp. AKP1]